MSVEKSEASLWAINFQRERRELLRRAPELYAPRMPMADFNRKYRVTKRHPNPPLIHYAIPLTSLRRLYRYADKHGLTEYNSPLRPNGPSPFTPYDAVEHLANYVQYDISYGLPYQPTRGKCKGIIRLFSNYTMRKKELVDEDMEDVISLVKEALGLMPSLRPQWYFDYFDSWGPGDSDTEAEDDEESAEESESEESAEESESEDE